MGNVVELERGVRAGQRPRGAAASPRPRWCWAAAGSPARVYEIGALRALDLLSVNRTVNQFDVYVGTSAGALVAALAANGVTPEQMMRVVNDQVPHAVPRHQPGHAAAPELPRVHRQGRPAAAAPAGRRCARSAAACGRSRTVDLAIALADALPSGLYSGSGVEEYVRTVLVGPGPHRRLPASSSAELYLAATDLDTCERIVLGAEGWDDVPISPAVRASAALPMVYEPVERARTASWSTAGSSPPPTSTSRSRRARSSSSSSTRSCPYVNDFTKEIPTLFGTRRCAASRTWASRRSPTRRSSCSPTSACTRWRASGRSAIRASTSS